MATSIAKYKPYAAYKPSGVPWLGNIPAHWEVRRTKRVLRERNQKGFPNEPLLAATQTKGVVRKEQYENRTVLALKDLHLLKLVRVGDFVISLRSFQGGIEYAREQGIISPAYTILYPRKRSVHTYLAWLFKSRPYIENLTLHVTGIRQGQNIDYSELSRSYLPLPPLAEQRAIAAFLDRETAKIDALVAKKERLIELLQEKRAALISRAVTKGLDSNVPMKDSGEEWLGEIPAPWEVKRLRFAANIQTGVALGKRYETSDLVTRPYLRVANVQDGYLVLDDVAEIELPSKEAPRYELRTNDVLLTEGGDFDKLGRGHVWSGQIPSALHQNHIFVVRPNQRMIQSEFLSILLSSSYGRAYFTATSKQSTNLASTNSRQLSIFPMPMPSLDEQRSIISFLDHEIEKLDALMAKVQEAIERLEELRIALISSAVTGKIDVREEAV